MASPTKKQSLTPSPTKRESLVNKDVYKNVLDFIRKIATDKGLHDTEIVRDDAVNIMQMVLLHYKHANHMQRGQEMIDHVIPFTRNRNFINVEDMICRLCEKQKTKTIFDEANIK